MLQQNKNNKNKKKQHKFQHAWKRKWCGGVVNKGWFILQQRSNVSDSVNSSYQKISASAPLTALSDDFSLIGF